MAPRGSAFNWKWFKWHKEMDHIYPSIKWGRREVEKEKKMLKYGLEIWNGCISYWNVNLWDIFMKYPIEMSICEIFVIKYPPIEMSLRFKCHFMKIPLNKLEDTIIPLNGPPFDLRLWLFIFPLFHETLLTPETWSSLMTTKTFFLASTLYSLILPVTPKHLHHRTQSVKQHQEITIQIDHGIITIMMVNVDLQHWMIWVCKIIIAL